jgi:hypothetical protein
MNPISNIWRHPRTSTAGLLIAVITVAGALTQQGVTLGVAGNGTLISVVSAVASALLGLLARDPAPGPSQAGTTAKLGAWALISLLLPLPFLGGCSGSGVAQDIVNWTPALQSAVATVDSTAALLAPADAPLFTAATVGFDAASNLLVAQARAYLANPSASVLAQMQNQIVVFQQQVNSGLLQVAGIKNSASQQHALASIQGVATIVAAILGLVQSISSKAAVAQMANASTIKQSEVRNLLDTSNFAKIVAAHYGERVESAQIEIARVRLAESQAGF